jgi:DNA phosphorothioation-dependent restriction protein DptH
MNDLEVLGGPGAAAERLVHRVRPEALHEAVAEHVAGIVSVALERSAAGARLRITTLPKPVMERVTERLQSETRWVVRVLCTGTPQAPWEATATKLIELRNVLREPLLVCIPPGLRTAAEDSLDIATFTELALPDMIPTLGKVLLARIPAELRREVADALEFLQEQGFLRGKDAAVEYLLTVASNGCDAEAAGGALFVFGLVPDFDVFTRGNARVWLSRNVKASQILADHAQPLQKRITRLAVEPNTIQPALFAALRNRRMEGVRDWTADIAEDPGWRHLAFERWRFPDAQSATELRLILDPLALPLQQADEVSGAVQLRVLDVDASKPLKVGFRAIPAPAQLPAWKTFRLQFLTRAGVDGQATVAWESNGYPKPTGPRSQTVRRSIRTADLQGLEEGTYYLRVEAYDEGGALLSNPRRIDPDDPASRFENESELFLVLRGGAGDDVEPQPTRAVFATSLGDAWLLGASRLLGQKDGTAELPARGDVRGLWQEPVGAPPRGDVHFQLEGAGLEGYAVVVPAMLRRLELEFLGHPERLGGLQLDLTQARTPADLVPEWGTDQGLAAALEAFPEGKAFVAAREAVFRGVTAQHVDRSGAGEEEEKLRRGVVETTDLSACEAAVEAYLKSFVTLVEALCARAMATAAAESMDARESVSRLRQLALLDTVELRMRKTAGNPGRALLAAPTHPLRLAWHLQHLRVAGRLLDSWADGSLQDRDWRSVLDRLRGGVQPVNLPMVLFNRRGRPFVEHGPLTTHWSLYLPDLTPGDPPLDAAACRDTVRQLLGIRGRASTVAPVGADDLADLMLEYVQHHPYAEQLRINVFNPGAGDLVAEALRALERRRRALGSAREEAPPLRYAIQLFGPGEQLDALGAAFESLLDPERQVEDDDEFTLTSTNHLLPKLIFARNSVEEFQRDPARFPAHLAIFHEHFGVQGRLARLDRFREGSFVHGLVQEPETVLELASEQFGWYRGLRPSAGPVAEPWARRLAAGLAAAHRIQATAATGELADPGIAPVVAVQLDTMSQALLRQAHDVSDWVLTIDRNIGLEYFDSPSSVQECGYLLDFSPEFLQEDRQRLLLTTRSAAELDALVRPSLERLGLDVRPGDELPVIDALRSMSGRLALRLLSSGTRAPEVAGLLFARWMLEYVGVLDDSVVIPLDAHRGWFQPAEGPKAALGAGAAGGRRADLLVISFHPGRRVLECAVVEVKWRESLSHAERSALYRDMREQAESTEQRFRERFDLDLYGAPRGDAVLQAKELTTLLAFYARRAHRYKLLQEDVLKSALDFVQRLDEGYHLDLRSLGVVFERSGQGAHVEEEEIGFPVHRIGLDVANDLLRRARGDFESPPDGDELGTDAGAFGSRTPILGHEKVRARSTSPRDADLESFRSSVTGGAPRRVHVGPVSAPPLPEPPSTLASRGVGVESLSRFTERDRSELPPTESPAAAAGMEEYSARSDAATAPAFPPAVVEEEHVEIPEPASIDDAVAAALDPAPVLDSGESQPPPEAPTGPSVDVLVGANEATPQYGLIGRAGSAVVGIDLTGCNTISLFGVQGFGKSYTLGVIAEMATTAVAGVNALPAPLATVIFHYHKSDSYAPEYAAAVAPNNKPREITQLLEEYGARPQGLKDVVLLVPEARVEDRRREFPELEVQPIKFASGELGAEGWKFLLGAAGSDALYVRQLVAIMRRYRQGLTLEDFRREIAQAELPGQARRLAEDRLALAAPYVDDNARLSELLRPGRTVIVDLRDEWVEKDEALGLFVVMLRIFANARHDGRNFNKLVVFDEAHKYITDSDLVGQVVETIREMRHQATSVVIASQDPLSVPRAVVELTSVLLLHRMTSPQWLRHLKGAIGALEGVTEAQLGALQPGEALLWAQRSTDKRFTQRPQRIKIRPRFSQHGGGTKTAVSGATVR